MPIDAAHAEDVRAAQSRVQLLGVELDNLDFASTLARAEAAIAAQSGAQHLTVDMTRAVRACREPAFRRLLNEADLVSADGISIVWASRLIGSGPIVERVTGVDLFESLLGRAAERNWSVYFLGADETASCSLVTKATQRWPSLRIAGRRNGYWTPEAEPQLVADIRATSPDILFIGISSPTAEEFMSRWKRQLSAGYALSVGGSFDVLAGKVSRAPLWMQTTGFEWLWRIIKEPGRLWKRYLTAALQFTVIVAREFVSRRS